MLGQVEIPFEIQSKIYPYRALIIQDLAYDAILGRDFLEQYEAKVDLKANVPDLEDRPSSFSHLHDLKSKVYYCTRSPPFWYDTKMAAVG